MSFEGVGEVARAAVAAGAFPGAVVLIGERGRTVFHEAYGQRSLVPAPSPMAVDTVFDLSSLTKALVTTTAMMLLVRDGRLRLDDRVARYFPNFGVNGKFTITIRDLLAHCSGFAAHRHYYKEIQRLERTGRLNFLASQGAKDWVYEQLHRERVEYDPGTKSCYSDLGFMMLGQLIELSAQTSLDRFCHERIVRPLRLRSTGFLDLTQLRLRKLTPVTDVIAPTEKCPWRGRVLCGEVHDDNAYAMGGVAGHAGLFSTAADVGTVAGVLLACFRGDDDFVPQAIVREFWRRDGRAPDSSWALGWDTPSASGYTSAGTRMHRDAIGHLGFTGTSIWIDPGREAYVVLLTNRVHPTRANEMIRDVRPRLHDAAMEALDR